MKLSINSRIIKQNYRICSYCTTTQSQATFADPLGYKCQMKISSVRLLLRKEMGGNLQVPNGKILFLHCYCNEGGGVNLSWTNNLRIFDFKTSNGEKGIISIILLFHKQIVGLLTNISDSSQQSQLHK